MPPADENNTMAVPPTLPPQRSNIVPTLPPSHTPPSPHGPAPRGPMTPMGPMGSFMGPGGPMMGQPGQFVGQPQQQPGQFVGVPPTIPPDAKGSGKGSMALPSVTLPSGPAAADGDLASMGVPTLPPGGFHPGAFMPPPTGVSTLPPGAVAQPSMGFQSKGMGKGLPPTIAPSMGGGAGPQLAPTGGAGPQLAPTMGPRDFVPPTGAPATEDKAEVQAEADHLDKVEDTRKWHNIRQFTAYMFTLAAFTILSAPTIISIQLGMDVDAAFWIGRWGLVALFIPVFLLGSHFYHLWMINNPRERRRYIFFVVPVLPAVLFMIIGGTYMSYARSLYGLLKSDDCSVMGSSPAKFWMQEAYDEARAAYDQCLVRLQKDNLEAPLRRHPNLQSCLEWDDLLAHESGSLLPWRGYKVSPGTLRQFNPANNHRWQYLADVEINHVCGGFCKPGPSLFVSYDHSGRQGGSCAQFVAFRFLSIHHWGTVVFTIGLLIILLSIPTYVMSRGFLNNMGYKSAAVIA